MTNPDRPVYRYPPRSHASSCRCPRCAPFRSKPGDAGIIGPVILIFFVVALAGFWPAMVWHGYGGPTGNDWRWDIRSTIAELVYFGTIGFIALMVWLGNRPAARPRPPRGRLRVEATTVSQLKPPPPSVCVPPPICLHRNAVKVDSSYWRNLGRAVIFCCWCPDCEEELPASFRLACCGTEPGDGIKPARHVYNCARAATGSAP